MSVVSGKGGAGKTTLAAAIARAFGAEFYDLDVDAPNAEYFLQPEFTAEKQIFQPVPEFNEDRCDACGLCTRECRFNALYKILDHIYLTASLCHSCGLCELVCPQQAIRYRDAAVGSIRSGFSKRTGRRVHVGDLEIGSTRGTYLIEQVIKRIDPQELSLIDGPPGNSCAAVAAIKPADLVVLVVEPTPFGFHDMKQTEQILKQMGKQYLVIANKATEQKQVDAFFNGRDQRCALTIPLDDRYHRANLDGKILSEEFAEMRNGLQQTIGPYLDSP